MKILIFKKSNLADSGEELDMSVETVVLQAPAPNTGKGTT